MQYLSRQDVLDLHSYVLERFGGKIGIASQDRLITAVEAPQREMFDTELYPDLTSKVAALVFHLIRGRPFRSGNEATALLAALLLLERNGAHVPQPEALAEQIFGLSRSRIGREELEAWLRHHLLRTGG